MDAGKAKIKAAHYHGILKVQRRPDLAIAAILKL
jgi:hypothetical protein